MSEFLDYLEESTNVVNSKNKFAKLILILVYLVIWAFSMIVFWCMMEPTDAMVYSLMFMWIIFPVVTFVLSMIIGRNDYWGRGKWAAPILFGVMYMLSDYATFRAANMASFPQNVLMPEFSMIGTRGIISLIGLGIGVGAYRWRQNRARRTAE